MAFLEFQIYISVEFKFAFKASISEKTNNVIYQSSEPPSPISLRDISAF